MKYLKEYKLFENKINVLGDDILDLFIELNDVGYEISSHNQPSTTLIFIKPFNLNETKKELLNCLLRLKEFLPEHEIKGKLLYYNGNTSDTTLNSMIGHLSKQSKNMEGVNALFLAKIAKMVIHIEL